MTSGYGSGGGKESVKGCIDNLEKSPSQNQTTSPVYGTGRHGEGAESAGGKKTVGFKQKKGGS